MQGKRRLQSKRKRQTRQARRRRQPRQTSIEFRPAGRGGARPGAGRPRIRRSRVAHRTRGPVPARCPVQITLRVLDDVPPLRRVCFVRAFRETLRKCATRPGFRVIHYSIQDDHAHFIAEAAGAKRLANGMKSLAARFARCVNAGGLPPVGVLPQWQGAGRPLPPRVEADPDRGSAGAGVRAAERAQALPPASPPDSAGGSGRREFGSVVRRLEGTRSAAGPLRGRGASAGGCGAADVAAVEGLASDRAGGSCGGAGRLIR